jgi:type III restriction enzyme
MNAPAVNLASLPPPHQKMVRQAVELFSFLENKSGQSLAPVFTPLLGPLDEASKAFLLKRLGPEIPTDKPGQQIFFEPDLSAFTKKDAEMLKRRGSDLRRTLVDHNGMSPIGPLRWCLQYGRDTTASPGGVFDSVRQHCGTVAEEVYKLVNVINTFRNEYVAHQNKELLDAAKAKAALSEWVSGLCQIWKL